MTIMRGPKEPADTPDPNGEFTCRWVDSERRWARVYPDGSTGAPPANLVEAIIAATNESKRSDYPLYVSDTLQVSVKGIDGRLKIHSDFGPAWIEDGTNGGHSKYWCQEGRRHRGGAPALVHANGEAYFENGVLHRSAGPAIDLLPEHPNRATALTGKLACWHLAGVNFSDKMSALFADIRHGGVIPQPHGRQELVEIQGFSSPDGDGRCLVGAYRLHDIAGKPVSGVRKLPSIHWLTWVLEHADAVSPQLAAAMRARAMAGKISACASSPSVPTARPRSLGI